MRASYTFADSWLVAAPREPVRDLLIDVEHYPEWWPQILAVGYLGPDDGLALCRSSLPYTLELVLHAVSRGRNRLEVEVSGDLEGSVRWLLTETASGTRLDFEQRVEVRGLLAAASRVARPLLRWNHDRMLAGCVEGLRRRLDC